MKFKKTFLLALLVSTIGLAHATKNQDHTFSGGCVRTCVGGTWGPGSLAGSVTCSSGSTTSNGSCPNGHGGCEFTADGNPVLPNVKNNAVKKLSTRAN